MRVLLTGGAGYIGSHIYLELIRNNFNSFIIDNLSNSKIERINILETLTRDTVQFIKCDITNSEELEQIFYNNKFDAVIHLAGLKSVNASFSDSIRYYKNNVCGTVNLLEKMEKYSVNNLIFSSTAAVYGNQCQFPIREIAHLNPQNPYAQTKLMVENIISDFSKSNENFSCVILRYFNPIGAHQTGLIGEFAFPETSNLFPIICEVAKKNRDYLFIYGNDYPTIDGTGVRDYIHIMDLANGHIKALEYASKNKGVEVFNLGSGKGYSVMDLVNNFSIYNKVNIPYKITDRRIGDLAESYADITKARKILNWKPERGLKEMCIDSWNWSRKF